MTHYAVLGIPENSDAEAIHDAYRARARQYHPDAGEGSSAGKFREVAEAYEALSDPARRKSYDAMLMRARTSPTAQEVLVEPLAQPWFSTHAARFSRPPAVLLDGWFEETFRAWDALFADVWFGRW